MRNILIYDLSFIYCYSWFVVGDNVNYVWLRINVLIKKFGKLSEPVGEQLFGQWGAPNKHVILWKKQIPWQYS